MKAPYFEDITAAEREKLTLAKFRSVHDKDSLSLTLKIWVTFFAVGALTIATWCAVLINAVWLDRKFIAFMDMLMPKIKIAIQKVNDIHPAFWTIFLFAAVAGILIVKSARKEFNKKGS